MKKFFLVTLIVILSVNLFAQDDLTIKVVDVDKKIIQVTYTWTMAYGGTTSAILPDHGCDFTTYPIKVISVYEKNTDQKLEYSIVDNVKGQSLDIKYPSPIPIGGSYTMIVTIEAKTDNITIDSEGRYVFKYETSQNPYFILPKGHFLVYSNYPVIMFERNGTTVCHVKKNGRDVVIFKTKVPK